MTEDRDLNGPDWVPENETREDKDFSHSAQEFEPVTVDEANDPGDVSADSGDTDN